MISSNIRRWMGRRLRRKADAARDRRDWNRAARLYARYLGRRPSDFGIWVQFGHVLGEADRLVEAAAAYLKAYAIRPEDADLALHREHLARRCGDIASAVDSAPEAVADAEQLEAPIDENTAPPAFAGRLEGWFNRTIWGTLNATSAATHIEFHANGALVGQAQLSQREDGAFVFRAVLDIDPPADGPSVEVHARSMPDGLPLDPPTVFLNPISRDHRGQPKASSVPAEIVKPFAIPFDQQIVLIATHSGTGKIKPHVLPYVRLLKACGLAVVVVAAVDRAVDLAQDLIDAADCVVVRRNAGYDFGSWSQTLEMLPALYGASTLYLTNDSMIPATGGDGMRLLIERVRSSKADLVALTDSHEWHWHVQSYFVAVKPRLLTSRAFHAFMSDVRILPDKDYVIQSYELGLAAMAEARGFAIDVLFPSTLAFNPVLFGWRELIALGFPFVKVLLLRGEFETADISDWAEYLTPAGFDAELIGNVLAAAGEQGLGDGSSRLLTHRPPQQHLADAPLRVAFYGPWNYDNGLGQASRGVIAALRRTGVSLNLHPVKCPFHIHKPLTPPVDIIDFVGRADVAIVHLNPDSWHLLTAEQRASIADARHRVGYWVWEMGEIPEGWRGNFDGVDRIWAPSRYCADVFAAADGPPVDVVPHAVPLPAATSADRSDVLANAGVAPDRRVILYIFDGSSYLVRKNPAALIRAFSASGLASRNWSLVLKTKHLHDRPEEGDALEALADATKDVVLIDRSMAANELRDLFQAADIYASPHCSEGFGLTIAEAMAAGKTVVATDFGGSRDILDASTGWPVKNHAWQLEQDFGHYRRAGTWARIDEPALTAALISAADALEASDHSLGQAARQRVADTLSYDRVAERITESLGSIGSSPHDNGFWIASGLEAGLPLTTALQGQPLDLLQLQPDGSLAFPFDPGSIDQDRWVMIAPANAVASPLLTRAWREAVAKRPDAAIFYGDDLALGETDKVDQLRLKPEFDPTLLIAQDYIGSPLFVRGSLLASLGLRDEMGTAVLDDLLLRAHHGGASIVRIPETLIAFKAARPRAAPADRKMALAAQPQLAGFSVRPGRMEGTFSQWRDFDQDHPSVSLIIPTCRATPSNGSVPHIVTLLETVAQVAWPMDKLHIVIGDDVSGDPDWAERPWPFKLNRTETPRPPGEPFNYAAKMNTLWRLATTEQIVLMNDDLRPIGRDWLAALLSFATQEDVGGVGARLLYPDGHLQHAGVAPQLGGIAHAWAWRFADAKTYQDWALVQREWSMITGAVFATRRSLLDLAGGFDEDFSLEFNDIDLSLRLRSMGYRIVYTPEAEMYHAERASRGDTPVSGEQYARFMTRWKQWLDRDPAWHPQLRRDIFDVKPIDDHWAWFR